MFAPMARDQHGIHDKENSSTFGVGTSSRGLQHTGKGKNVLQPPQQQGGSIRKALGNITNTTSKQQINLGAEKGGKPGGGAAPTQKRAFGVDITNSGALKQQQPPPSESSVKHKPLQSLEPLQLPLQQPQSSVKHQQPKSKAELYAEGGVECLAGKSFKDQEADRLQREERDIDQRVKQLTSAMGMWKPQGGGGHSDFEEDDLSGLSMTPSRIRPWNAGRMGPALSPDDGDVPLLLPDSPTCPGRGGVGIGHAGLQQRAPFITILPDPELDLDFDELM